MNCYYGFADWTIVHGSFDADKFVEFLEEKVIAHINPFPGLRSVLIMDNSKIHYDEVRINLQFYLIFMKKC